MARRRTTPRSAEHSVVEAIGRLAESWGLRRNLGRAWTVLFLRGSPVTATELQAALALSTGAVSMTLRELQRWGVIRRVHRPGERQKHYTAEVDVWRVVARVIRGRELAALDEVIDHLEQALGDFRAELTRDAAADERRRVERMARRTAGLLDVLRIVASLLRGLVTTARLDASALTDFRLGGPEPGDTDQE
jgi:HTH-type transcriptional regulator, glycine betaine synthesis regulator